MNFGSYFFSDKIALVDVPRAARDRDRESGGLPARRAHRARTWRQRMGLPMPKLYLIPDESPNAFATGRNPQHASVAFTAGILRLMDDSELEGVIAHELGHVLHRDILISSVAATIAAAITMLARMAFWFGGGRPRRRRPRRRASARISHVILAPIAAMLIQMAISRSREYSMPTPPPPSTSARRTR